MPSLLNGNSTNTQRAGRRYYLRKSHIVRELEEASGTGDLKQVLSPFAGWTCRDVLDAFQTRFGITVQQPNTVREMFLRTGIPLRREEPQRRNMRGQYQQRISELFSMPISEVADRLLLPFDAPLLSSDGSVEVPKDIDPFDKVQYIVDALYPCKDRLRAVQFPYFRRRDSHSYNQIRYSLLSAVGERSFLLGLDVHNDVRFPKSLLELSRYRRGRSQHTTNTKKGNVPMLKSYSLSSLEPEFRGQVAAGALSLSAGDVLFFSEGIGLKIVPVMKADGTLEIPTRCSRGMR